MAATLQKQSSLKCYLLRAGKIVDVEELLGTGTDDALLKARMIFDTRGRTERIDSFELWDGSRLISSMFRNSAAADDVRKSG